MDKYAIIQIGGKQIKVSDGTTFEIENQKKLDYDVLAFSDGKELLIGAPYLKNVKLKAKMTASPKKRKTDIVRFKAKSRYHKAKGHKQPFSRVVVESVTKETVKVVKEK